EIKAVRRTVRLEGVVLAAVAVSGLAGAGFGVGAVIGPGRPRRQARRQRLRADAPAVAGADDGRVAAAQIIPEFIGEAVMLALFEQIEFFAVIAAAEGAVFHAEQLAVGTEVDIEAVADAGREGGHGFHAAVGAAAQDAHVVAAVILRAVMGIRT